MKNQTKKSQFSTFEEAKQYLAVRPQLQKRAVFFDPSVWSWILVDNNRKPN